MQDAETEERLEEQREYDHHTACYLVYCHLFDHRLIQVRAVVISCVRGGKAYSKAITHCDQNLSSHGLWMSHLDTCQSLVGGFQRPGSQDSLVDSLAVLPFRVVL